MGNRITNTPCFNRQHIVTHDFGEGYTKIARKTAYVYFTHLPLDRIGAQLHKIHLSAISSTTIS